MAGLHINPQNIKPFWQIRHSIYLHENVLLYQNDVLSHNFLIFFTKHIKELCPSKGMFKKQFNPGLMRDIEILVLCCITSKTYMRKPPCSDKLPDLTCQNKDSS